MKKTRIIMLQVIFLVGIAVILYLLYPKTNLEVDKDSVSFKSINSNVIIISENPDFSNARYIDVGEKDVSFTLYPGTYYWKSSNNYITGWKQELRIESEVGMEIDREEDKENKSELVNIGNVKINVTRSKEGVMVGHIILMPNQSEKIEDSGGYTGRQEND